MTKQTALYDQHQKSGAKLIDFNGWMMPLSYDSVLGEHAHVREHAGIFDVSHMGEFFFSGADAKKFLQFVTLNDVERLAVGMGQYSALLNENAGFVDDLILYRLAEDVYMMCVNAGTYEKDFAWLKKFSPRFDVNFENQSNLWSQIALQGPRSFEVLKAIYNDKATAFQSLKYMHIAKTMWQDREVIVARSGYTGELGYELYLPHAIAPQMWESLLTKGKPFSVKPIGLGARDSLRLEAGYMLYGNDLSEDINPIEADLGWVIKRNLNVDFVGKKALNQKMALEKTRKIMNFKMVDKGIPRSHMDVYFQSSKIGSVTSGGVLPTVGGAGGFAMIDPGQVRVGDQVSIDIVANTNLHKLLKNHLQTQNKSL